MSDRRPIRRGLALAAILIMLGNGASRVLGIGREQVIAGFFGATPVTSAFATASTIPTIFYDLLIGGAVSAALIPVLSTHAQRALAEHGERAVGEDLDALVSTLLTGVCCLLLVVVAALVALAPLLAPLLGVPDDPTIRPLTVQLIRVVVVGLFFLGLSGIVSAASYARQIYVYPALAIALFNVGLIVCAWLFHRSLGAYSLALGVVVGAALQLAAQLPGLFGLRIRPRLNLRDPAIGEILKLYGPVAAGLVVSQLGVFVDRNLAWRTGESSVAIMRFATTLVQFPLGLIATATSLAVLPTLSRLAGQDDTQFRKTFAIGLRLGLICILPLGVVLIVLRVPVIVILFQHGVFDATSTAATANAFLLYAPQLPFVVADQLLIFAFYARKDTITPMLVGMLGVLTYLVVGVTLIGPFGLGLYGLVIANTVQNSLHAVVLFAIFVRVVGGIDGFGVETALGKAAASVLAMALVMLLVVARVPAPAGLARLIAYVASVGALGGAVYLAGLALTRTDEMRELFARIPGRARSRLVAGRPHP